MRRCSLCDGRILQGQILKGANIRNLPKSTEIYRNPPTFLTFSLHTYPKHHTRRRIQSPPSVNPWTMASCDTVPEGQVRQVDQHLVAESWADKQTKLIDDSAKAQRRAELAAEADKRAAAEEAKARRREREEFIELSSDDEEEQGERMESKDVSKPNPERSTASEKGKENTEALGPELAELAARRREQYEAQMRKSNNSSGTGSQMTTGGHLGGVSGTTGTSGSRYGRSSNPLLDPPRYEPSSVPSASDLRLSIHDERCEIRDASLGWYPCTTCLDTGNGGCTLIGKNLALRMGLCDAFGTPTGGSLGFVEVRGVVAGASERISKIRITYRIKGKVMNIVGGITNAQLGCDLLVSRSDIAAFELDGYTLSAR